MIAILCLVPFIGQAQELQAPFAHPGLNHSRADLERMKEKVLAKEKPWIDGWDALCAFRDAQSDFKASPKPSLGGTDRTEPVSGRRAMPWRLIIISCVGTSQEMRRMPGVPWIY